MCIKLYFYYLLIHVSSLFGMQSRMYSPFMMPHSIQVKEYIKKQSDSLPGVIGPIPDQISLLAHAYKNYEQLLKTNIYSPSKVLLFGPQGSGKSHIVAALTVKLHAHMRQLNVCESSEYSIEKWLQKHCEDLQEVIGKLKKIDLSILHCQNGQNLFKNQQVDAILGIIYDHAQKVFELKKVQTLFIVEQREHPTNEVIHYFDQVIQMPALEWKQRRQILEYYLEPIGTTIDWQQVKACLTEGMTTAQLAQIARESVLRANVQKRSTISTDDLNASMQHWYDIYKLNSKNAADNCPQYMNIYS